jgi:hypothetical protein
MEGYKGVDICAAADQIPTCIISGYFSHLQEQNSAFGNGVYPILSFDHQPVHVGIGYGDFNYPKTRRRKWYHTECPDVCSTVSVFMISNLSHLKTTVLTFRDRSNESGWGHVAGESASPTLPVVYTLLYLIFAHWNNEG